MAYTKSAKNINNVKNTPYARNALLILTVKESCGKICKLTLPIKIKIIRISTRKLSKRLSTAVRFIKIDASAIAEYALRIDNINLDNFLINSILHKKINFILDHRKKEGTVMRFFIKLKVPEGKPVSNPPPPLR